MGFLLIGIGVDDMFVVANAIDQTPFHCTAAVRFREGLRHAGPSMTITSLTDALAFYFGSFTTIPCLSDFCIFACFCVICLFFLMITLFFCILAWDTKRVGKLEPECCGLCCCKEDSAICCRGRFLSDKQRKYSGINDVEQTVKDEKEANA